MALPFRLFVANTVTGQIVTDVPFVGVPKWEYRLNSTGGLTASVPIGALSKRDLDEFANSWRWSWGFAYGSHIFQAGPAVTDRYTDQEGPPTADVGCGGLMHLFTKRIIKNSAWTEGQNIASPVADLQYTNLTLRTIARRMIENDMAQVGHSLPIALPAEDAPSTHERYYPGYDLATVGERLQQLTQVNNGPEVEFRPVYTDDNQLAIRWEMRVGNPRLGRLDAPHVWDYGAALTHVDYDRDGSQQTMAHFEKGNGDKRDLLTAYQDDKTLVNLATYPYPELETVGSDVSSTEDGTLLQSKADGYVATHGRAVISWAATVRIDGTNGQGKMTRSPSIDQLRAGDTATMRMQDHRRILDGTYTRRVLGASSGSGLYTARLVLQPTE